MKNALTLVQLFNLCDWVIALFIAGTVGRIEGKDGRRTFLAVGLGLFFLAYGGVRFGEFVNLVFHREELRGCLGLVSESFNTKATILAGLKTTALLFTWFAVSVEKTQRAGILSGNVIRGFLIRVFEKLR